MFSTKFAEMEALAKEDQIQIKDIHLWNQCIQRSIETFQEQL